MRLADAGPRTWLLAALAGWAVALWLAAAFGMGGSIAILPADPALSGRLPQPAPAPPERIGPLAQYADVGARPLFSDDRRPQPFTLQPESSGEQAQAFDFVLTSVLITPGLQMAIVQPAAGGDPIRMKLGEAPAEAQGWRLVSVEPRSAVFEGPQGEKSLELRTFDGTGGEAPTVVRQQRQAPVGVSVQPPRPSTAPAVAPDAAADAEAPVATVPVPAPPATGNTPPRTGSDLPDTPMTPEAQMEAIRKRIEARRAQLREEAQRQQQQQNAPNR